MRNKEKLSISLNNRNAISIIQEHNKSSVSQISISALCEKEIRDAFDSQQSIEPAREKKPYLTSISIDAELVQRVRSEKSQGWASRICHKALEDAARELSEKKRDEVIK